MILNHQRFKEVCEGCNKSINLGQATTECQTCTKIIHTKCFKKADFVNRNNKFLCRKCQGETPIVYNPFKTMNDEVISDSDRFYDQNITDYIEPLANASNVLDNCKNISAADVKHLLTTAEGDFTSIFYNIDGNKSNFDTFATELKTLDHNFSVVGFAETNANQELKDLYPLDGYNSFYNPCVEGKLSGTGVALYVKKSFNVTLLDNLCYTKESIETLFVKLQCKDTEIVVGVVYRSPNFCFDEFQETYDTIVTQLNKESFVHILGDFNIDLHKCNDKTTQKFENFFLSKGLLPSISLQTHKRENSSGSCIDNIYTFNTKNICHSGVISNIGKYHSPIFTISKLNLDPSSDKSIKQKVYYDYSSKNIEKFIESLTKNSNQDLGFNFPSAPPDFSKFIETFSKGIDEFCKLSTPKLTKRTFTNNPWITEGIIMSVVHKQELYETWKGSCNKQIPDGNPQLYENYASYRKSLKGVIALAKSKFYKNKILDYANDHKKTWEVINQIRGKNKHTIKPSFIINNERIVERRLIAQEFNNYFASLASNMNKKFSNLGDIPLENRLEFQNFMPQSHLNSMFLYDCTTDEVSKIISDLENGKSSDIPVKINKMSNSVISPILACHFNYLM